MGAQASADSAYWPDGIPQEKRTSPVTLHCYDYFSSDEGQVLNGVLRQLGTGAFHCGVEVYGKEYSFRGKYGPGSGVFAVRPKTASRAFRESVAMGITLMSEPQVFDLLKVLMREWQGNRYDLLKRNCCHFCDELCKLLGVGGIPDWVTSLADTGKAIRETLQSDDDYSVHSSGPPRYVPGQTQQQQQQQQQRLQHFTQRSGHYNALKMSDTEVSMSLGAARDLERHQAGEAQGVPMKCFALTVLIVSGLALGAHVRAKTDAAAAEHSQSSWPSHTSSASADRGQGGGGGAGAGRDSVERRAPEPMDTAVGSPGTDHSEPGGWPIHVPKSAAYDCQDGNQVAWDPDQRSWCCRHEDKGCRFDCRSDFANLEHAWSDTKRDWCCRHAQLGCRDVGARGHSSAEYEEEDVMGGGGGDGGAGAYGGDVGINAGGMVIGGAVSTMGGGAGAGAVKAPSYATPTAPPAAVAVPLPAVLPPPHLPAVPTPPPLPSLAVAGQAAAAATMAATAGASRTPADSELSTRREGEPPCTYRCPPSAAHGMDGRSGAAGAAAAAADADAYAKAEAEALQASARTLLLRSRTSDVWPTLRGAGGASDGGRAAAPVALPA